MFSSIIIIPLIGFSSLARPINFLWHLSKWSERNDWLLSFVRCVRHYVTYVGSLLYLEPIIWWVGRKLTSVEIRVGKGELALKGYLLYDPNNNKKHTHSRGSHALKCWCHQSQSLLSRLTLLLKRCEEKQFLLIVFFIWAACLRLRGKAINVSTTYCWKKVCW